MKFIYFLALVFISYTQTDTLIVYRVNGEPEETYFETQIFEKVIRSYEYKTSKKFHLQIEPLNYYSELFTILDNVKENQRHHIIGVSAVYKTKKRSKKYDFSKVYLPTRLSIFGHKNKTYTDPENI